MLEDLKKNKARQIHQINIKQLRSLASKHYAGIMNERNNYDSKYAITRREKVQLEMIELAKDRNRKIEEIVEQIAIKASPRNSEIRVYTTKRGVNLEVLFDMAEVATGEEGTQTKHESIDSLKRETIRLISQVSTDLYEFCRDLELNNISIGLKHRVKMIDEYGSSHEENVVIYKVNLSKRDIESLEHNPFLDRYAIKKYFSLQHDEFPYLKLQKKL